MNKNDCTYYLYADISKYFKSVNPLILKKILERKIKDDKVLRLLYEVIDSSETSGIPIGNLLSQMFANIYLNDFDFFVQHYIKPKGVIRYMDDFVLLFASKQEAWEAKRKIEAFLSDYLCINLNKKTRVGRLRDGITFCGYKIKAKDKKVKQKTIDRMSRKEKAWENGKISSTDFIKSIGSSIGRCKGTSSHAQVNRILLRALRAAIIT